MRAKSRAAVPDLSEMPDWLLTDIGIRRSDLPRKLRWLSDPGVVYRPGSSAHGWHWEPIWRRE